MSLQWCLDTTVRYLKERHQFGRPVGSFQALKHRLADVWLELVTARAAARYAADALAAGSDDVQIAVSVAQAHCSLVAVHAAEEAIQLHGGIGMTWEHPAHLFLKRAKSDEIALGTPGRHRHPPGRPGGATGPGGVTTDATEDAAAPAGTLGGRPAGRGAQADAVRAGVVRPPAASTPPRHGTSRSGPG